MKHMIHPIKPSFFHKACFLLSLVFLCGCQTENEPASQTGFYFDTVISVTVYDPADSSLLDGCFALAKKYENMLSKTVPGSDIWNINHAGGTKVTVSEDTILLLNTALSYARLTDGKIDPTIGIVSSLWNFTENTEISSDKESISSEGGTIPFDSQLQDALSHVDYRYIRITDTSVTLTDPSAEVDLGFIAKGFIADQMKVYLKDHGVKSALINLGGNVLALGSRTDGSPFKVGIQKPFASVGTTAAVLPVSDLSVVSSGTYERYFKQDGKIYHHILDTKTGYPVWNSLSSVTILSSSSMEGDALSTTCFVLGLEKGMELIESLPGTEAIFITDDGSIHASSGAAFS